MPDKTNADGYTFSHWLARVDVRLEGVCGLGTGDLADQPYWDQWNDGVTPKEAAHRTLEDEGFPF